jgi:hypothetical protein
MSYSNEELAQATERFERLADNLDPDAVTVDDTSDLRAIAEAADAVKAAQALLNERVAIARARGRSWNRIAVPLGVSRQAARERFAEKESAGSATDLMSALEASLEAVRKEGSEPVRERRESEDAPPTPRRG